MTPTTFIFRLLIFVCLAFTPGCKKNSDSPLPAPMEPSPLPRVSTSPVAAVTDASAIGGGAILSEGSGTITEAGICWDTVPGAVLGKGGSAKAYAAGNYTCSIKGLKPYTTYYVRAYASNALGTAYGKETVFKSADLWTTNAMMQGSQSGANCMAAFNNRIIIGTTYGLFYSDNDGTTWQGPSITHMSIVAAGAGQDLLFAASSTVLYKSVNNGQSWSAVITGSASIGGINDILVNGNDVYAAARRGIYISHDGGTTWQLCPSMEVSSYRKLARTQSAVLAINDSSRVVYRSTDKGATWTRSVPLSLPQLWRPQDMVVSGDNLVVSIRLDNSFYVLPANATAWVKHNGFLNNGSCYLSASDTLLFCGNSASQFGLSYSGGMDWQGMNTRNSQGAPITIRYPVLATPKALILSTTAGVMRYRR